VKLTIGFSKPKNKMFPFFSWLIRLWDNAPYSHVYIRWTSNNSLNICYQASRSMVHFLGEKVFNQTILPIEEYELDITQEQYQQMLRFCVLNSGVNYSFKQILGIVLAKVLRLSKNPFSDQNNGYVCSELIAQIMLDKLSITFDKEIELLTPRDINIMCKKHLIKVL